MLVDNGDLIQGSPLGDYMAAKGSKTVMFTRSIKRSTLWITRLETSATMSLIMVWTICITRWPARNSYVNANIIDVKTQKPLFTPYLIKETSVIDKDGHPQTLKIGYIGFVPPQIMIWDKANLSGKVTVNDITETARKYVPEMREKGADIVVVIAHSGLSADPYHSMAENSVYYLSEVPGVDAIMFGHAHAVFPVKILPTSKARISPKAL